MAIRILSDDIINQISAGEVVERPANIVKVPNDVDSIAKAINPPIWLIGISTEANNAIKPILEPTSSKIGYPTSVDVFLLILSILTFWIKFLR